MGRTLGAPIARGLRPFGGVSGASPLLPPLAPTIALGSTFAIGGTLTWGAVLGATSYTLYRDGVLVGTVTSGYALLAADLAAIAITVRAVNAAGSSPDSNALGYSGPASGVAWFPMDANLTVISDASGRGNDLTKDMVPEVSALDFMLGGNSGNGTQQITARMAGYGIWKRLLTSAEKTALQGGEMWPFNTTTSLRTGCTAYFLLNEASGASSYADATGRSNDLSVVHGGGSITQVTGPGGVGFAAQFHAGAITLTRSPVTADLQLGNTAQTVCCWVNMDAKGSTQQMFGGQFDGNTRTGTVLYYHEGNDRFQLDFGDDIDLYRNSAVVNNTFGSPSTGTWYLLMGQFDPVANQLTHSVTPYGGSTTSESLPQVQQPLPILAGQRWSTRYRVNPDYRATTPNQTGWDLVGKYCTATRAITADLSIGNNAKTVRFWLKLADRTTTQAVMGPYNATGNVMDWSVQLASGVIYGLLGNNAGGYDFTQLAIPSDGLWHQYEWWYDKAGDGKLHMARDNRAVVATPVALTHTPSTTTIPFVMGGAYSSASLQLYQLLGQLALVSISTGAAGTSDSADHFAAGAGLT